MFVQEDMSSWRFPYRGYPPAMVQLSESESHENVTYIDLQENESPSTGRPFSQQRSDERQIRTSYSSGRMTSLLYNPDPTTCEGSLSREWVPGEAQFQTSPSPAAASPTTRHPYGLTTLDSLASYDHNFVTLDCNRSYSDTLLDEIAVEDLVGFHAPFRQRDSIAESGVPPDSFPPGSVHHGTRDSGVGVSRSAAPHDGVFSANAPQSGVASGRSLSSGARPRSVSPVSTPMDDTVLGSIAVSGVTAGFTPEDGILPGSLLNDDIFSGTLDCESTVDQELRDKYTLSKGVPAKNVPGGAMALGKLFHDFVPLPAIPVSVETYVVTRVTKSSSEETQSDLTGPGEQTTERQETELSPREFNPCDLLVPNFGALASAVTNVHFENQTINSSGPDQRLGDASGNAAGRQISMLDIVDSVIENTIAEHSERQSSGEMVKMSSESQDPGCQG